MKWYAGIDYGQRPGSYWEEGDVLSALLRNVKGRERREAIRDYHEQGRLHELDETFLRETLSEEERERLGKIHPAFMGGEYLPDYADGEVEIARIELESTTRDVVSIRAAVKGAGIAYRIIDEYDTEFELGLRHSREPLLLAELIGLIDGSGHPGFGTGLALCYNQMHAGKCGRGGYRKFTRVSSEIYPQLAEHYERVYDDWVNEGEAQSGQVAEVEGKGQEGGSHVK
jgi:hypothetical protein